MKPDICLYLADCLDAFTAAWVVKSRFPSVQLVAVKHGDPAPVRLCAERNVVMVAFTYPAAATEQLSGVCDSLVVLDYHKAAAAALAGLPHAGSGWEEYTASLAAGVLPARAAALFDETRSGARLAWDFLHPGEAPPRLVRHVEERALGRLADPATRAVCAALASHRVSVITWQVFAELLEQDVSRERVVAEGAAIERQAALDLGRLLASCERRMLIAGYKARVINAPWWHAAEAGQRLAEGAPFAATYYDGTTHREFNLQSSSVDGWDVSEVAAKYGGGGDRHAARFRAPLGWEGDAP